MGTLPRQPAVTAQGPVLGGLARDFLRLGATTFGGPAVHLAVFRETFVRERGWMDDATFTRWLGAVQVIPGPNSSEMAMLIGRHRAGWAGMIVAGGAFILPSALLLGLLAWAQAELSPQPGIAGALAGLRPVMLAVMADALRAWLPEIARELPTRLIAAGAAAAALLGAPEVTVLLAAGLVRSLSDSRGTLACMPILAPAPEVQPWQVAWPFLKAGALLFGSGYVVVGLLRDGLVTRLGWITDSQLADAFALSLATPGPILGAASYLGMQIAGPAGALLATGAIFLPAFVVVGLAGTVLPRLEGHRGATRFLEGVGLASVGLLLATTCSLLPLLANHPASLAWTVVAFGLLATRRVGAGVLFWAGCLGGLLLGALDAGTRLIGH
ncbi:MAG: chromate efflux transporter [Candidatus Sericytochromatia bacterium]|nr:chromate efflux transporter [Candidatus Sericytochromatia bacterium]